MVCVKARTNTDAAAGSSGRGLMQRTMTAELKSMSMS